MADTSITRARTLLTPSATRPNPYAALGAASLSP